MTRDSDALSRLNVDLMTSKSQSYDEVVAFSERILNENFSALFRLYPEMKKIKRFVYGQPTIDATLNPSRIIIPNDTTKYGANVVFYQIRFQSGTIRDALGINEVDVAGWELAIPCTLGYVEIDKESKKMIDREDMKEITVDSRRYAYPGDYSVSRLYAQLATAKWGYPDVMYSYVVDNTTKQRVRLDEWKRDNDELFEGIRNGLTRWVEDHDPKGVSTLNVKFTLPSALVVPEKPTYTPTFVRQQAYPHIGREFDHSKKPEELQREAAKAPPQTSGKGYNCLLWCEMVDGHAAPTIPDLSWSGNFIVEPTEVGGVQDQGTFALSYQHFLESHLLPRLQTFNQATDISNLSYEPYWKEAERTAGVYWNYSVGYDPKHSKCDDDVFKFKRVEDFSNKENPITYKFYKSSTDKPDDKETDNIHHWEQSDSWHWHVHNSNATVTVSWPAETDAGSNKIQVKGHTEYLYESKWSTNKELTDTTTHLYFKYYVDWKFNIILSKVEKGTIHFQIDHTDGPDGPASLSVTNDNFITDNPSVPKDTGDNVKKYIKRNLHDCIGLLENELQKELSTTAKFTYPGTGDLEFSDPIINRLGNVLAKIKFKEMTRKEGYVEVSEVRIVGLPTVPTIKPKTTTVDVGEVQPGPKLTWQMSPAQPPAETNGAKFQYVGTNKTASDLAFGYIRIMITSGTKGPNMLATDCINGVWNEDARPATTTTTTPHSTGSLGNVVSRVKKALTGSKANEPPSSSDPTRTHESAPSGANGGEDEGWDDLMSDEPGAPGSTSKPGAPAAPIPPAATNTISIKASSAKTVLRPTVLVKQAAKTKEGLIYWIVDVLPPAPGSNGYFVVPKGESISYDFVVDTNLARKSSIFVTEHWKDSKDPTKEVQEGRSENTRWAQDITLVRV